MHIGLDRALAAPGAGSDLENEFSAVKSPRTEKTLAPIILLFVSDRDGKKSPLAQLAMPTESPVTGSRQQAQASLDNIQRALPAPVGDDPSFKFNLSTMERVPMEAMFLASTMLANQILGDTAEMKGRALSIMSDKQDQLRKQEVEQIRVISSCEDRKS